jgi:hypothetical protein
MTRDEALDMVDELLEKNERLREALLNAKSLIFGDDEVARFCKREIE